ncbi:Predicted membrane protein [Cedecea neteri]|uniref:Predicted membrane protein n=1 Tax=Cedecea neteri TaxID=158822 RepID=A0A2X2T4M7_9ENTR|nr:Predicted membrane protein [Cedecea neteri]
MLVYWLDIVGTAVFAISGVLLAGKLRMDPFGVLVLGVVTAVGGGTIRDMALANGPVFWVKDPTDLVVAMVTCMLDDSPGATAATFTQMGASRAGCRRPGGVRGYWRQ